MVLLVGGKPPGGPNVRVRLGRLYGPPTNLTIENYMDTEMEAGIYGVDRLQFGCWSVYFLHASEYSW